MSEQRVDSAIATSQADLRQQLGRKRSDLESNATFLTFEPGLYAIDFKSATHSMSDVGLPLPCARLEAVPMPTSPGRAFISMSPEGGWLSGQTSAAHVLVVGGRAGAVLTIYRPADGMALPEVHFRSVLAGAAVAQPAPAAAPSATVPTGPVASLLVHVEGLGDRTETAGSWAGDTSGQRSVEGFALSLPEGMAPSDLEYQGIMGEDWRTPWFESGAFCGSRGLQLPLLGFCLRLVGDAAGQYECRASGQFASKGSVGPVASGEDCYGDGMPLTAMKVDITAIPAAPAPAPEPEPKKTRWRRPLKG